MNKIEQIILFPICLLNRGGGAAALAIVFFMIYTALLFIFGRIFYGISNVVHRPLMKGPVQVEAVKIIAAHRELQGRYLVNVPDRYILDLRISGKLTSCEVPKSIFDSTSSESVVVVEYIVGRFDGKPRSVRVLGAA
ncbi:hypothetical protein [Burkholderia glumae]|uniref:hypothetical protein n=1 Tax=Burkholderia glumae TaxID=337 RepID=UPI0014639159|nr:hypothetical protein [Burkholderia glumae]QJP72916.1 hypothetical protein HJC54_22820 [Burkholderia glumae]